MSDDTITIGKTEYLAVWLKARVRRSKNEQVFIVRMDVPGFVDPALFYARENEVRPTPINGEEVDGAIRALVLGEPTADEIGVLVSGEAVSYGPQMVVPRSLVE